MFTLSSKDVGVNEVVKRPRFANVKATFANVKPTEPPTCDENVIERLEEDIATDALADSTKQDVLRVTELVETTTDHQPAVLSCDDGDFGHFEEVQER